MTENKEKQEKIITERTSEQACREIEAIIALLNMRTTEFKYTQQGVGQKKEMLPSGSWEYSPIPPKQIEYLAAAAISLVHKFIEKGELVTYKERVEAAKDGATKQELPTAPLPEAKMEVVKEESNKTE